MSKPIAVHDAESKKTYCSPACLSLWILIALAYDLHRFLNKYKGVPIKYVRARELIDEITGIAFRHHLRLPATWWLVGQTLVMLEGIGLQLDPDFDVFKAAEPHAQNLMKRQYGLRSPC